jgi:hypothetical protein
MRTCICSSYSHLLLELHLALHQSDLGLGDLPGCRDIGLGLLDVSLGGRLGDLNLALGLDHLRVGRCLALVDRLSVGSGLVGIAEVVVGGLLAAEHEELLQRVVDVPPGTEAALGRQHRLFLEAEDGVEKCNLLRLVAEAEADCDGHVAAFAPVARIHRDPLAAQLDRVFDRRVLASDGVDEQEEVADAGLGKDARDHLHAALGRAVHLEEGILSDIDLGQSGRVEAGRLPADASAGLADAVHVRDAGHDRLTDRLDREAVDAAGHLGADDAADAVRQEVIDRRFGDVLLGNLDPVVVERVDVVEEAAQESGLDLLNVHREVGDRPAPEAVADDHRGHRREGPARHLVDGVLAILLAQNLLRTLAAGRDDLVLARLAVLFVLQPAIVLDDDVVARCRVEAGAVAVRRFGDRVALQGLGALVRGAGLVIGRQVLDLVDVVALANQLVLGDELGVEEVVGLLNQDRLGALLMPNSSGGTAAILTCPRLFLRRTTTSWSIAGGAAASGEPIGPAKPPV